MSVGTTNANGMLPNNEYERYNFSSRNTTKFLNDKLTLDVGFSFIIQKDLNLTAQGQYFNPLSAVYLFPRGENFGAIQAYETFDIDVISIHKTGNGVTRVCKCRILIG